ncbi:MAG: FHA domain-containing protein [Candidatus Eremiobacteraeota bacterium]|nr:FHA domain-containing protein [Candidatus Eremiobacteraeota bacterium]
MTFAAHMRIGSLEIMAALLGVAVFAARPRVRPAAEVGRLRPMRLTMEVVEFGRSRPYEGRPPFEAGRGHELDLVLRDPEVSRRHVRFENQDGVVFVEDLHSSNGTFLNGRKLTEAIELRQGDAIDVGTTRLVVTSIGPWKQ